MNIMVLSVQLGDIGLLIDLIGAILLFFFGLAPLLSKDGSMSLSTGNSDYLRRKAQRYERLSRLGVFLVFVGFLFQLLGNHIGWSTDINLLTLILFVGAIVAILIIVWLVRRYKKRKYDLVARYLPQFDQLKPSHVEEQMWKFTISNNSKQVVKTANLYLSVKPSVITELIVGEGPRSITPAKKVQLKDVQPSQSINIQIWNIGGHITAGLDCYLEINGRIVRPKVFGFEGDEE